MSRDAAVGNVDSRVVKATIAAIEDRTDTSTDTRARMLRHVERFGHDEYGEYGEAVTMPSRATFYRLVDAPRGPLPDGGSALNGRQPPSPSAIGSDGIGGRGARHGSGRFAVALGHPPRAPGLARVHRMLRPPVVGSLDDKGTRCPGAVRRARPSRMRARPASNADS